MNLRRARQRGFTLIELMIALLVSSLLVGMILAIFSRMSLAYRSQQQLAGLQQLLAAARATIELDAKQAGLGMPQGFKTAAVAGTQWPVQVVNASAGPDQIALFYADTSIQAVVTSDSSTWPANITVDQTTGFTNGMLVVLATASTMSAPVAGDPDVASYDACVLRITNSGIAGTTITFDQVAPWGQGSNTHCSIPVKKRTMMYRFVARAYRIDSGVTVTDARKTLGVLQQSTNGGLLGVNDTWTELAYGFCDIQTAVRKQELAVGGPGDLDNDGDATRNWYSGNNQAAATATPAQLLQMTISLVAHTDRDTEGIASASTPNLIGPNPVNPATNPAIQNNNQLGDRAAVALPAPPPPWPNPLLPGARIYRYTTFQIDFRNLGIGQL